MLGYESLKLLFLFLGLLMMAKKIEAIHLVGVWHNLCISKCFTKKKVLFYS
jgi:hypothetical protein